MEVNFSPEALSDIAFWKNSGNKAVQKRITALLQDIKEHPFRGMGKPEALKYNLSGYWSRRITNEHRLVYKVNNNQIMVISCRFHY
jgi:toxin YoeB